MVMEVMFATVEDRDAYVDEHYPVGRGDEEVPGLFHLPDGRTIGIVALTLREYRR